MLSKAFENSVEVPVEQYLRTSKQQDDQKDGVLCLKVCFFDGDKVSEEPKVKSYDGEEHSCVALDHQVSGILAISSAPVRDEGIRSEQEGRPAEV